MSKRLLAMLLSACVLLSALPGMRTAQAAVVSDETWYGVNNDNTAWYEARVGQRLANFSGSAYSNGLSRGQCAWYCRGRASEKLGFTTAIGGNARDWYSNAQSLGLSTGYEIRSNSIACFSGNHVIFVEWVDGDTVYYTEANKTLDNVVSDDDGQLTKSTQAKLRSRLSSTYQGCIYLSGTPAPDLTVDNRYSDQFYAYTNSTENVRCYYGPAEDSSSMYIYPDDRCLIQEIYTNGWCKVLCPWPDESNMQTRYTRVENFLPDYYSVEYGSNITENYMLHSTRIHSKSNLSGDFFPNIGAFSVSAGTHFKRMGYENGRTQGMLWVDGTGFCLCWFEHTGSSIGGLNIGQDFYAEIQSPASSRVVSYVAGSGDAVMNTWAESESQIWKFEYQGNGFYRLTNCQDTAKVLDVTDGIPYGDTNVGVWNWNGSDAQLWELLGKENGQLQLHPRLSDCVLDTNGGGEGASVLVRTEEGHNGQSFRIVTDVKTTLIYDANGGSNAPGSQSNAYMSTVTLSSQKPTPVSYTLTLNANGGSVSEGSKTVSKVFQSWNTAANGTGTAYASGGTMVQRGRTTLYAQYDPATVGQLPTPTRSGYSFAGWFTAASGGSPVSASTQVTGNMTLYAHWEEGCENGQHTYTYVVTQAPTLTAAGSLKGTCSACGNVTSITLPKLSESDYTYTEKLAPACVTPGTGTYTWKVTAYGSYGFDVEIPALGHNFVNGYCTRCGAIDPDYNANPARIQVGAAAGVPGDTVSVPVTIRNNTEGFSCFRFRIEYSSADLHLDSVEAKPGDLAAGDNLITNYDKNVVIWFDVKNCTAESGTLFHLNFTINAQARSAKAEVKLVLDNNQDFGNVEKPVAVSLEAGGVIIELNGHDYGPWTQTKAPTCTEPGEETRTCTVCGAAETREVPALGHSYGAWTQTKAPTCTAKGEEKRTCTRCDAYETREVPALGHNMVTDPAVAPTCTASGLTEGSHCTRCDYKIAQEVVPPLGHNYGQWQQTKAPTCTEKGEEKRTCTRCDAYETREVPALGHYMITDPAVAPTCTETGLTEGYHCARCDYKIAQNVVPALGHNYGEWTQTKAPTCTVKGEEKHTCTRCDAYEIREVPALGHNFVEGICTRCGAIDPAFDPNGPKFVISQGRGSAGNTVVLTLSMENNPGIVSAYLDLTYDTGKLELVDVEDAKLLAGALFGDSYASVPFALNWDDSLATENNTQNGVLAKLTFKIRENCEVGAVPVCVRYASGNVFNVDMESVNFACVDGGVDVVNYMMGDVDGDLQVNAKDVATLRRYLAHWKNITIIEPAADVDHDGTIGAKDVARLRRFLAHWQGITLDSVPVPDAEGSAAKKQTGLLGGKQAFLQSTGVPTLTFTSAEGKVGDQVTVELVMANNPGVVSVYLDMHYDDQKLKLVKAEDTKLLNGAMFTNDYSIIPFALNWDDTIAEDNNYSSGVIARLTFEILEGCASGPATVSLTCAPGNILNFDLDDVIFQIENGTVSTGHVHEYQAEVTPPTCTEQGYTTYTCACGDSYIGDHVPALGHDFGEWTQTKAPTCTEQGEEKRDCTRCDASETREIAALGHNMVTDPAVAPTCTETGLTEGSHCTRCDYKVAQETIPALGHDFGEWTQTKAPTCTEQGEEKRDCTRCDASETREIAALGHNMVTDPAVAPTCTETGLTEGSHCARCDYKIAQTVVPALGHDMITDPAVAPTCTETGLTEGSHCTRCDYKVAQETIPALGHDFGEWKQTKAPTCTEKGEETRNCTCCDASETRDVRELGHDMVTDPAVAPTCTETGLTEGSHCTRCDYKIAQETIPALGHDFGEWTQTKAPTCTEQGEEKRNCNRCDAYETREVPALGHDMVVDEAVAPTCTETGLTEGGHCTRCDYKIAQTVVPALGHDMITDPVVAPTCTKTGLTEGSHCSRCDHKVAQTVVPALGHDMVTDPAVAATCTETGLTEGSHCTRCDYKIAQKTVPALGHSYGQWTQTKAPTCTVKGEEKRSCTRCDASETREIAALGHSMVTDPAVAAACTETGLTEGGHCTRCDYKITQTVVPALGHSYGAWTQTKAPTCTVKGEEKRTCTRCDAFETRDAAALGHNMVTDKAAAATCAETGLTEGSHCTRCDYKITQTVVPALGHDTVTDPTVAPTCTKTGLTEGSHCSRCDYKIAQTVVPALGHDMVTDPAVAPTCTETGLTEGSHCSRCDYKIAQTVVPALGHDMVTDPAVAPTCTETGLTEGSHCSRCDHKVAQEVIPALGHAWGEWTRTKAPTVSAEGEEKRTCTACGTVETRPVDRLTFAFDDVKDAGKFYYESVYWAVANGVTSGKTPTTFAPDESCTRAQVVTFLWRACGSPKPTGTNNPFTDVKSGQFYTDAVLWAMENGVTSGVDATHFKPNDKVTRAQFVTFLWRAKGKPAASGSNPFKDVAAKQFYTDAVIWAVNSGVTSGLNKTTFGVNNSCTRGQVVTFLYRAFQYDDRYQLVVDDCSWTEAFAKAKELGGHLVTIETEDEYNEILSMIRIEGMTNIEFRVGARRDADGREYHWVDSGNKLTGEVINSESYWLSAHWQENEPSFSYKDRQETVLEIMYDSALNRWVWNDIADVVASGAKGKIGFIVEF